MQPDSAMIRTRSSKTSASARSRRGRSSCPSQRVSRREIASALDPRTEARRHATWATRSSKLGFRISQGLASCIWGAPAEERWGTRQRPCGSDDLKSGLVEQLDLSRRADHTHIWTLGKANRLGAPSISRHLYDRGYDESDLHKGFLVRPSPRPSALRLPPVSTRLGCTPGARLPRRRCTRTRRTT